jgi:hypothetical protein
MVSAQSAGLWWPSLPPAIQVDGRTIERTREGESPWNRAQPAAASAVSLSIPIAVFGTTNRSFMPPNPESGESPSPNSIWKTSTETKNKKMWREISVRN